MKATWVSKASKRKTKETPQRVFLKKGLRDKKERKTWMFEREDTSKKNKIGRNETI